MLRFGFFARLSRWGEGCFTSTCSYEDYLPSRRLDHREKGWWSQHPLRKTSSSKRCDDVTYCMDSKNNAHKCRTRDSGSHVTQVHASSKIKFTLFKTYLKHLSAGRPAADWTWAGQRGQRWAEQLSSWAGNAQCRGSNTYKQRRREEKWRKDFLKVLQKFKC